MEQITAQVVEIPVNWLRDVLIIAIILVITFVVAKLLGILVLKTVGKRDVKVAQQTKRVVVWLTWLVGGSLVLSYLGLVLIVPVIIVVIGIIVAIAFRDFFLNVTAHEVITTYSPFKIGDWIQVGEFFGRVVDVTWMDTVLMTTSNEMVYIPNSTLMRSVVVNRTTQSGVRISVSIPVEKSLNYAVVEQHLLEIGGELSEELATGSKPEVRLIKLGAQTMTIALLLKINNPSKGKLLASEVRKRMKMKLDELRQK